MLTRLGSVVSLWTMAQSPRYFPAACGLELLPPARMYAADRAAIDAGTPGIELMENAGRTIFREIVLRWSKRPVVVVCGPGNNGGDGFVVARLLGEEGWPVSVLLAGDPKGLRGDAAKAAARWNTDIKTAHPDAIRNARLIVDALFGAGLGRDIEGDLADLVCAMNESGAPIVSVDVPSGIDGDTGLVRGCAVSAALSITFCRRKPGHLLMPGRRHAGEVVCTDIGIPDSALPEDASMLCSNAPALWRRHCDQHQTDLHKYDKGHVVVVSGGRSSTGAARLAATAALRAGAGLVTVASPRDAIAVNAAQLTSVMLKQAEQAMDLAKLLTDRRMNVVAIGPGCGVGGETRAKVKVALASGAAVVLDADALTSFAQSTQSLFDAIAERPDRPVIMTPHEGEFACLFKGLCDAAGSKYQRASVAAARSGAIVVLKGPDTVIAAPSGQCVINENATASLATAGSGDVLSGIIAAFLARGLPAFEAAAAGAWCHGAAGAVKPVGLTADDLPDLVGSVLRGLGQ